MRVQPWHVIVFLVVVVLVFGANRLPDIARSVGQSLKVFKREMKDLADDDKPATKDEPNGGDGQAPKA